jgi:serine/threonine protein phosphatase PrpC
MYGSSSIIGRRPHQQDALCVGELVSEECRLFGIYDGHGGLGGGRCSKLAATQLQKVIKDHLAMATRTKHLTADIASSVLVKSFVKFDNHLKTLPIFDEAEKKKKWAWLYGRPPADFNQSGSCACVVMATPDSFVIANLGDSRAILSNGTRITMDHTPLSLTELARLYEAGAWVAQGRVYGRLVPTRAFGDFELKQGKKKELLPISNVPEIHVVPRSAELPKFIIVMCDGIHDALKDSDVAKICEANSHLQPETIADLITAEAYKCGSKDNLSCIVIRTDRMSYPSTASLSSLDESDDTSSTA